MRCCVRRYSNKRLLRQKLDRWMRQPVIYLIKSIDWIDTISQKTTSRSSRVDSWRIALESNVPGLNWMELKWLDENMSKCLMQYPHGTWMELSVFVNTCAALNADWDYGLVVHFQIMISSEMKCIVFTMCTQLANGRAVRYSHMNMSDRYLPLSFAFIYRADTRHPHRQYCFGLYS